jgi:RimJ/RimL family protein N-acetyltransferase
MFPLQTLQNKLVHLQPLTENDFETLFAVAADPLIWEQHPNPDRYKRDVFATYFKGALESGGALLLTEASSGKVIGCSRFYDYEPEKQEVKIGYTFFARSCWGKGYNSSVKKLMLDYACRFAETVIFHVGAKNMRSRKAMEKLGAEYLGEEEVAYYGEAPRQNVVFRITRADWNTTHTKNETH